MSERAFEAARRNGFRGWFWFPSLEPDVQLPTQTRRTINEKVSWLYNNVDALRVVIDALTLEEVDTGIWPKATTSDPDFNRIVTDAFHNTARDPRFFDAAGRESYYSAQWQIRRNLMAYGELFGQFIRPDENGGTRVSFINPWRVGDGGKPQSDREIDGVATDALGKPVSYSILGLDGAVERRVDALDMMSFRDRSWVGQTRCVSPLAPVVRKMLSLDDIEKAETSGVLLRTRLAYAIERKEGDDSGPSLLPDARKVEVIEGEGNTKTIVQTIVADEDGTEVSVADVPAGRTLRVIESAKAAQTVEFLKWLLSGLGNCSLYPSDYAFNIAGIGQGTVYRGMQRRVQRVKNTVRQFQLIPQFCDPYYRFWLWHRIQSGAFGPVARIPSDWWRVRHICPADDSVDVGREGRLFDERIDSGKMSPEVYHGMAGEDAEDVEDEVIAAKVRRLKKIEAAKLASPEIADALNYDMIFRKPNPPQIPTEQAADFDSTQEDNNE